jgi:hypothetical protein
MLVPCIFSWPRTVNRLPQTFPLFEPLRPGFCASPWRTRVEAGWNTSIAVPVSRKRRHKGNTVSDETVMYGYWSSVTGLDL